MIRNLKALGLVVIAVLAMGALSASSASAAEFHSESTHTILDGQALNTQVFENSLGIPVKCSSVGVAEGTISGSTATEVTVKPVYSGCVAVVAGSELEALVEFTTCDYLFTNATNAAGTHYVTHVNCTTPGDEIHIKVKVLGTFRKCFTIPAQTPTGGGVTYTNNGLHVDVDATVTGIEYTAEGLCGSQVANDATYTGSTTVTGTDTAGKEVGISFS